MQLSPEEELEVRSCLAAIETEERKKELKKKEKELKEKEEKLVQKATEIRNATIEAKRVAAQLQLMAGQLGRLANQILAETKKYKNIKRDSNSSMTFVKIYYANQVFQYKLLLVRKWHAKSLIVVSKCEPVLYM